MFYHVVLAANGNVIGKEGQLPWNLAIDLGWFRYLTYGHTLIMGSATHKIFTRKTVRYKKPWNIVQVSRKTRSLKRALTDTYDKEPVFIIGGQSIFDQTMDVVKGIWMVRVHMDYKGNKYYPGVPEDMRLRESHTLIGDKRTPKVQLLYYEREWKEEEPIETYNIFAA